MTVQYTNRKGKCYCLHQGTTKTGKPKYFFALRSEGELVDEIPEGYEIYENPNSQVFLRKMQPKLILEEEVNVVEVAVEANPSVGHFIIDVKNKYMTIYTAEQVTDRMGSRTSSIFDIQTAVLERAMQKHMPLSAMMRFELIDEDKRMFVAERYCFRGSVDDWIYIGGPDRLEGLVKKFVPHLEDESFYSLH